ncbi:sensor histidine kinase [Paenibacillus psychroresistens]|uniref:Sensor histidine kinase n=1 Tax=Paenibacillus psychroresistens TaxID=1778678 RepID=A0A6B8RVA0_9BACL|nr:sensor histidine kinase [Paenibacillus psychroresistens]QGQ99068.1 sensor histidine kinase [Paenibacillus psychroresistens]
MGLNKKILLAFVMLIILPLLGVGWLTYSTSQTLIETKYGEQTEITLKAISKNIYYVLKEVNYFSDNYAILNSDIQETYRVLNTYEDSQIDLRYENGFEAKLRRSFLSYSPIQSVALYANSGATITASNIYNSLITYAQLRLNPVFKEVQQLKGIPLWIAPGEHTELFGKDAYFYQLRIVKDFYNTSDIGTLLLQIRLNELEKIFHLYNSDNVQTTRFMLVNKAGLVLFDNNEELQGTNILENIEEPFVLNTSKISQKIHFQNTKSIITSHEAELGELGAKDWIIVSITPLQYVTGQINLVIQSVGVILALFLISALIFNFAFVNSIIRFILRVAQAMKRVERGDLTTRVDRIGKDETAVLSKGFNSFVARIGELLEEVKLEQTRKNKAEMMLLQAQIKPHFLFNTLESINILAVRNEGAKVSQMVHRLGNILRISFHGKEEITLKQEFEHLCSYLEIQKYRFEDLFDYQIEADEEVMECGILKLTLQPLVENCIQHGFEGIEYRGLILIHVYIEGERLMIRVQDNGIGMSNVILAGFQYKMFEDMAETDSAEHVEQRGLGVRNVADRLRIHYGKEYGLFICSGENQGTTIQCVLPNTKLGDDYEA